MNDLFGADVTDNDKLAWLNTALLSLLVEEVSEAPELVEEVSEAPDLGFFGIH